MKTKIIFTLALALAILSSSFANVKKNPVVENQKIDVQLTAENQIVVRYLSNSPDKVKILVYDNSGKMLSKKSFKNQGHSKITYELKDLANKELNFKILVNKQVASVEHVIIDSIGIAAQPVPQILNTKSLKNQEPLITDNK